VLGPLLIAGSVAREEHFGPAFLWLALPALFRFRCAEIARTMRPGLTRRRPDIDSLTTFYQMSFGFMLPGRLLAGGFVDFPLLAYHFQKTAIARPAAIPLYYAGAMG